MQAYHGKGSLPALIDCDCSCSMQYTRIVVFVSSCLLVHLLKASTCTAVCSGKGGLNYEVEAHCLTVSPPPPFFLEVYRKKII